MIYFILKPRQGFYDECRHPWLKVHHPTVEEAFEAWNRNRYNVTGPLDIVEVEERIVPVYQHEELITPKPYLTKVWSLKP